VGLCDLDAEVAGRKALGLSDSGGHRGRAGRAADRRDQGEDPRAERGAALRHRYRGAQGRVRLASRVDRGGVGIMPLADQLAEVWARLDRVTDPELDDPITDMGFVEAVSVTGAEVSITFRLPTYWCSPNFAFLMA